MKVVLLSNYLNHHQLPLCLALAEKTDGNFTFIATKPISEMRLALGYRDMDRQYPFVLRAYESEENRAQAQKLLLEADVAIWMATLFDWIMPRLRAGKLSFDNSERLLRSNSSLPNILAHMAKYTMPLILHRKNHYLLSIGAYAAGDYFRIRLFRGRAFRWGYFPNAVRYDPEELLRRKKPGRILWAGRLLQLKHPESAVLTAKRLRDEGVPFEMQIIGSGEQEETLRALIAEHALQERVTLLGAMTPEQVRRHMEEADVFLFTSDRREGWGAVVNEAMNSGCAVVASKECGSVPYLIRDGENGLIFSAGDQAALDDCVLRLMRDAAWKQTLQERACRTIMEKWNAEVAAERLLRLSELLLENENADPYADGPCSRAPVMKSERVSASCPD